MNSLYTRINIQQIIYVDFNKILYDMRSFFMHYAKENLEGKCRKEGFVRPKSTQIILYTAPILKDNNCIYNVTYSCEVCNQDIDQYYNCKIMKLAKIGIRGIVSHSNNPIVFYISREHNQSTNFDEYKEGDDIIVKIIGKRFQLNDPYIEVIAELE